MARKISRNSRAARRYDGVIEPEVKSLSELPRHGKTNLSNIIIRTTAKNEALLEKKLTEKSKNKVDKKKSREKLFRGPNRLDRNRLKKALNFSGRLNGKIAKSASRAKYIQNVRKAGWDTTNELIREELASLQNRYTSVSNEANAEEENEMEIERPAEEMEAPGTTTNMFDMLPDESED